AVVREALYQAAHVMLTKPVKGCSQLKSWAMRIARRAGMRKAPWSRWTHGPWHLAIPRRPGRELGLPALEALRSFKPGPATSGELPPQVRRFLGVPRAVF